MQWEEKGAYVERLYLLFWVPASSTYPTNKTDSLELDYHTPLVIWQTVSLFINFTDFIKKGC